MVSFRKYLAIINLSFQSLSEYRLDFLLGIIARAATFLVLYGFWYHLATSGMDISPYTIKTLGLYYGLIYAIGAVIHFDSNSLAWEIREGYTSIALVKPINYITYFFAASSAERIVGILLGILILGILVFVTAALNLTLLNITFFMLAVVLAVIGNFLIYYIVGLLAIWTQQVHGFRAFISIGSGLVSGSLIPIDLLPQNIAQISQFLPFRYFIYTPVKIILGQATTSEIYLNFTIELFWIAVFYLLYRAIWRSGSKRLESVGI